MNHRILSIPLQSLYMSADAEPVPGGYVVPERGNVTFTCSSSLGGLLWTVDLKVPGGKKRFLLV